MSSENPSPSPSAASAPTVVLAAAPPARRCQNCGEALLGEHCYACGQPTKGLVRHFSSIFGDFFDSVLNVDSRTLRTLGPLLFRPGYLSEEYFAGRRVRYVSPVRLFVFLSILAFFAARMSFDISDADSPLVISDEAPAAAAAATPGDAPAPGVGAAVVDATTDAAAEVTDSNPRDGGAVMRRVGRADTVAEVEAIRDQALAGIAEGRKEAAGVLAAEIALDVAEEQVRESADERIAAIRHAEETGEPLAVADDEPNINFGGGDWDAEKNPLVIDWLPDAGNRKLNEAIGRAQQNLEHINDDPNRLKDALLSTVPTTLFILLPLFALFLKAAYIFKRRLYMEHLIVALHSHSFLCLALLLALVLDTLKAWTATGAGWLSLPLGWLEIVLLVWMPCYLLLMQKRVYRQGWIMTTLKFGVLGTIYVILIGLGFIPLLMFSLVTM